MKIKLRAWNKQDNEMIDWLTMSQTAFNRNDYNLLYCVVSPLGTEIFDVMQFTGLIDKTGKEVFEGDIVKTDVNRKLFEVKFNNYSWQFDNSRITGKSWNKIGGTEILTFDKYVKLLKRAGANITVVGNIYQNPELIQGRIVESQNQ